MFEVDALNNFLQRTYLIERIIGIGCYFATTMMSYILIKQARNDKNVRTVLNFDLFALVVLAFVFVPDKSKDLYRILELTEFWKNVPFAEIGDKVIAPTKTPIGALYIYLCRKTQIDGFLPAATAFLFYYNVFYCFKELYNKKICSARSVALSYLFFMSAGSFLEVISDIRCFLAFSIIGRCIFDEMVLERPFYKNTVLYLISGLMHAASIPLIFIRLVFMTIFESGRSSRRKFFEALLIVILFAISYHYLERYVRASFDKAVEFISTEKYSYGWEYLIGSFQLSIILFVYLDYVRHHALVRPMYVINTIKLLGALACLEVCLCFEYNIFHRFVLVSSIVAIPFIAYESDVSLYERGYTFNRNVSFLCLLLFLLVCVRGNLSGYKFFIMM